jgi:protein arginine N-methyltransferase 3
MRTFVTERLAPGADADEPAAPPPRDDDSHYFESYGEAEIHQIMLQDGVRTATYGGFILRSPAVFRGAVVLDVGCGTGILSLFAARAGARKVYAVDAAPIAEKARAIVKANELEDVITSVPAPALACAANTAQGHPREGRGRRHRRAGRRDRERVDGLRAPI